MEITGIMIEMNVTSVAIFIFDRSKCRIKKTYLRKKISAAEFMLRNVNRKILNPYWYGYTNTTQPVFTFLLYFRTFAGYLLKSIP
jgi:hypothetical protein